MLKKTIKYTDYNGTEREEDFYFNLTEAELMEMEMGVEGGYIEMAQKMVKAQSAPELMKLFKDLILKSYGEKSADGKRFVKSEKLSDEFAQTPAYSVLFMELATDDKAGAEFVNGIVPADLAAKAKTADLKNHPALNN